MLRLWLNEMEQKSMIQLFRLPVHNGKRRYFMKRHLILIAAIIGFALVVGVSASVAEPLKWSAPMSRYPNQWAPSTAPPQQYYGYGYPQHDQVDPYGYGMHGHGAYGYGYGAYGYGGNYGPHPGLPRPGRGQFHPGQFSGNPYSY